MLCRPWTPRLQWKADRRSHDDRLQDPSMIEIVPRTSSSRYRSLPGRAWRWAATFMLSCPVLLLAMMSDGYMNSAPRNDALGMIAANVAYEVGKAAVLLSALAVLTWLTGACSRTSPIPSTVVPSAAPV